ncbi:MAG: hypothetical protein OSJ61_24895 [Lachnospiraceae bacterium]|nr:hypothetical protein [Lachnospiraceae bacterium]
MKKLRKIQNAPVCKAQTGAGKHKKYLDDVIVHLHARNTPLQGIGFF